MTDSIAQGLGPRVSMKMMGNKKRKPNRRRKKLIEKKWMSGLAMCSSGPQGQTEPPQAAKGRANSELRNVAPQGEAAAEAPKQQRAATTSPLGRSSTTEGSKRSACRRQEAQKNLTLYIWYQISGGPLLVGRRESGHRLGWRHGNRPHGGRPVQNRPLVNWH